MDFNYTEWASLKTPGKLKRDYRYDAVAFWNNYIPAVIFLHLLFLYLFYTLLTIFQRNVLYLNLIFHTIFKL